MFSLLQVSFEWSVRTENDTEFLNEQKSIENSESDAVSFLSLNDDYNQERTYSCIANNSVGIGGMCSMKVEGKYQIFRAYSFTPSFLYSI